MAFANVQTSDTLNTLRSTTNQALSLLTAVEAGSLGSIDLTVSSLTAPLVDTGRLVTPNAEANNITSNNISVIAGGNSTTISPTLITTAGAKISQLFDSDDNAIFSNVFGSTELTVDDLNVDNINSVLNASISVVNANIVNANTVNGATLKTYDIKGEILGNVSTSATLNLANANFFSANTTGDTTWTFSTPPDANNFGGFVLSLGGGGNFNQTWPASVRWAQNTAPTLTAGTENLDILVFVTYTGGTIWHGAASILNTPKT